MPNHQVSGGFKEDFKYSGVFSELGLNENKLSRAFNGAEGFGGIRVSFGPGGGLQVCYKGGGPDPTGSGVTHTQLVLVDIQLNGEVLEGVYVNLEFTNGLLSKIPDETITQPLSVATTDCGE